jgi:hypothetical protein
LGVIKTPERLSQRNQRSGRLLASSSDGLGFEFHICPWSLRGRHDTQHNDIQHHDIQHHDILSVPNKPILLKVVMQNVVMPIVVMLSVEALRGCQGLDKSGRVRA